MPYPEASARSPGSCSSDGGDSSTQSDGDSQEDPTRIQFKVKRIQANSRERKRMHTVNSAFDQLRELVPTYPSNRKLSKIDTLRLACTYIQDLVSLLHSTQAIGEDVLYNSQHHQPQAFGPDTFTAGYPVAVKQELSEQFPGFTDQFRMQPACLRFAAVSNIIILLGNKLFVCVLVPAWSFWPEGGLREINMASGCKFSVMSTGEISILSFFYGKNTKPNQPIKVKSRVEKENSGG